VDIQPAYDGHRDLLKLPEGRTRPLRIAYAVNPDAHLSWGGLPAPGRGLSSVRPDACHLNARQLVSASGAICSYLLYTKITSRPGELSASWKHGARQPSWSSMRRALASIRFSPADRP
jgi:hypothetical protein